jgi:integrase
MGRIGQTQGNDMATIEKRRGGYRLVFWYQSERYQGAIKAANDRDAKQAKARVERNLQLFQEGRIECPPGADFFSLMISDGKLNAPPAPPARRIDLGELFDHYKKNRPPSKEGGTAYTEDIHLAHLLRILGGKTAAAELNHEKLQGYVNARRQEDGRRGSKVSHVTVKKELGTLSSLWNNWALPNGLVTGPLPTRKLDYGKKKEKPPFQTWKQIERKVAAGASPELWDSVYLTVAQVGELLEYVRTNPSLIRGHKHAFPFVYPMFAFCAHTGARRSELLRSRREDFDFEHGVVTIREKKKDRSKEETYRHVPMTPTLRRVMQAWFAAHPGGRLTFCTKPDKPLSEQMANHHFRWALEGGKWKVLRGWHCLRHTFVSNLACKGIDQRIIMGLVGHLNAETTQRYQHLFPSTAQDAMRLVFG